MHHRISNPTRQDTESKQNYLLFTWNVEAQLNTCLSSCRSSVLHLRSELHFPKSLSKAPTYQMSAQLIFQNEEFQNHFSKPRIVLLKDGSDDAQT